MNRLIKAIDFAANKHRNQRRKDAAKTPYINHPVEVMRLISDAGIMDEDILMAAVLHDTVEDTETTYDELVNNFGTKVADIVMECSDDKNLPKEIRKQLQIEHARFASDGAKYIKYGDKYSNLSGLLVNPPSSWSSDEIHGYAVWSYAVIKQIKGLSKHFDDLFDELFTNFGICNISDEDLESELIKYYVNIKQSE